MIPHNVGRHCIEQSNNTFIYLHVHLQRFADEEKTEKATPKKRQDARKKGQVFQSRDLSAAILLLAIIFSLRLFGSFMTTEVIRFFDLMMKEYNGKLASFTVSDVINLYGAFLGVIFRILMPTFGVAVVVALGAQLAQIGFLFTTEPVMIKLEKLNPLKGFKRMFSLNALVELLKSIAKISIIGLVGYWYVASRSEELLQMVHMDVRESAFLMMDLVIEVGLRMALVLLMIGIIDFMYQKWSYEKNLKMSKKEIKDEYKQQEGNPEVKAKIKQKQRQISMQRMMQEVPKADVIITNPVHFAVAIKYDLEKAQAPYVIAKGQDYLAIRLKEIGKAHRVHVVENKPLARALYASVEVGQTIPQELYQAVAEILAFVYNMKGKTG